MALRAKAIILTVVVVFLVVLPNLFIPFLILLGLIAFAFKKALEMWRRERGLPVSAGTNGVNARVGASAPAAAAPVAVSDAPAAVVLTGSALVADALVGASAPEAAALVGVPVGASALAADAPADAAGKKRRKPESSSTSSSSSRFKYDVYLNFRDLDTRNRFADHLYHQLVDEGIKVFREDELAPDKDIVLEQTEAMKRSRILIAILSKNSASSRWCLHDLARMWECRESNGQTIIPIFYDVSPEDINHLTGEFGRSFQLHKIDRVGSTTIETWRGVLRQIGRLRGFSPREQNGHDAELVKRVVAHVVQKLKKDDQVVADKLVGIDPHVERMMRMLGVPPGEERPIEVQGEDVRAIGICGLPGVGKTTLAKVVFDRMRKFFDAWCFLEDVRSEGVQFSRRTLIADLKEQLPTPPESSDEEIEEIARLCHNAKVLIVLDDVDGDEQIKALAGNRTWFGPGSRVIVTTNNKMVLDAFVDGAFDREMVEPYEVRPMDPDHALQLFCKHAFQGAAAEEVSPYFGLSMEIAKAIGGHPSDIVDHASTLRNKMNIDAWKTTLDLLQQRPKR